MAIRTKTIQYAFPMQSTVVPDAVTTNLTQITVYIPESSPTFVSVFTEVGFQDIVTATGGTITSHTIGLSLNSGAYTSVGVADDVIATGENIAGTIGPTDFTGLFQASWTGTSMTCDMRVFFDQSTGTTLGMNNVTGILYITYTYDDTAATQIKTVRIPFESLTGPFSTTAATVATIPQLTGTGGMLPEAGVVIRDWYLVMEGNEMTQQIATDFTMNMSYNSGTAITFMFNESALLSDRFCRWLRKETSPPTPSTTNTLQIWTTGAARVHSCTITLVVTYEFTLSGTTRTLNSVMLPYEMTTPIALASTEPSDVEEIEFYVLEPGSIVLRNSAVRLNYQSNLSLTSVSLSIGSQAFRSYTNATQQACGMYCLQQRLDSGSEQGAGFTIARGLNTLRISAYSTVLGAHTPCGYAIINYESDIASEGIGSHNATVLEILTSNSFVIPGTGSTIITNQSFAMPAEYWMNSFGYCLNTWQSTGSNAIIFKVECLAGEGKGGGMYTVYSNSAITRPENGNSYLYMNADDLFYRFPDDTVAGVRINPSSTRRYRFYRTGIASMGFYAMATYHSITYSVAGTLSGNNASLPTSLKLVHVPSSEVRQIATVAAGNTTFSFTVYDDTDEYFVQAYQSASLIGSSAPGTAQ